MESNDLNVTQMDSRERLRNLYFQPGDLIAGRYEFIRELGHGGMGRVYLCSDTLANSRLMAVKTVPDILRDDQDAVEVLTHEYDAMYDLTNDGIVAVRNLVKDDFRYYVVMDYAEGETLDAYLKRVGRPDPSVTLEVARRLAAALDYAHGKGLVHRDVKPGNVMVQIDGNDVKSVKLLDFGLGLHVRESVSHVSGVMTSGTPAYKSPEQWRPDLYEEKLTRQSDQYSLAALVYEMLAGAGKYPFHNFDLATFSNAVLNVSPKRLDDQPEHVNDALQKALAKKPEDRFENCAAFVKTMKMRQETIAKTEVAKKKSQTETSAIKTPSIASSAPKDEVYTLTLPGYVPLELIRIQAGSFMMGSPYFEKERYDDETQHRVTLTKDYWLGKYLVTQAQWKAIMGDNPSFTNGYDYPVENVTWDEAMKFCKKLTKLDSSLPTGYEYTLPTEAQWEYAARGGCKSCGYLYSGGNNLDDTAWYDGNSSSTHPVGQKRPNELGLYDMSGNVWEWCRDRYGKYPNQEVTDPIGPTGWWRALNLDSDRVLRGGSWGSNAGYCRSARRFIFGPTFRYIYYGFRVALASVQ